MTTLTKHQFNDFINNSTKISDLPIGTRFVDISGKLGTITFKEDNITWSSMDCYANCANVIPTSKIDD